MSAPALMPPPPPPQRQQAKPIGLQKPPGYREPYGPPRHGPRPPSNKPPIPPSFPHRRKSGRNSFCRICCCCFCLLILFLILVTVAACALFYLWFDPRLPVFHLQSFSFRHFNVSVKSDGTYLDAATVTRVEVRNPSGKLMYYYGHTGVEVSAGKEKEIDLGTGSFPGFRQGTKNATSVKIVTKKSDEVVDDGSGPRLMSRYKSKDLVVNVVVRTSVGLILQGQKIGPLSVKVICGGRSLNSLSDMPQCTINLLKWINLQ